MKICVNVQMLTSSFYIIFRLALKVYAPGKSLQIYWRQKWNLEVSKQRWQFKYVMKIVIVQMLTSPFYIIFRLALKVYVPGNSLQI
jgi:hypothetical protein